MIGCDYCLENLSAYLDLEMSECEIKEIEIHLKQCDSCALELNILKTIVSTCSELLEELPEGYGSSLHTKLERAKEENFKKDKRTNIRMFSQIAAGFLIVTALGIVVRVGFFDNRIMKKATSSPESAPMSVAAGSGEQRIATSGLDAASDEAENVAGDASEQSGFLMMKRTFDDTDNGKSQGKSDGDAEVNKIADDSKEGSVNQDTEAMLYWEADLDEGSGNYNRAEDYDTVVTITVEDVGGAMESIIAIDKNLEQYSTNNVVHLEDSIHAYRGGIRKEPVELKLVYVELDVWQSFLAEMELIFPDIQIDSVPSEGDKQYVRIIIQKEK